MTKLAAKLPEGEANGLASLATALLDAPEDTQILIVAVDCKSIVTDVDTGDAVPTARICRIEPVLADDLVEAKKMMSRGLERRTGKTGLPFGVDPDTGEVLGD